MRGVIFDCYNIFDILIWHLKILFYCFRLHEIYFVGGDGEKQETLDDDDDDFDGLNLMWQLTLSFHHILFVDLRLLSAFQSVIVLLCFELEAINLFHHSKC
jgi:hypothetical protein